MATGLLVVCVGRATKLADQYQALEKTYSGSFRLGEGTPSYDADTPVNKTLSWQHISDRDLEETAKKFLGDSMQLPPMFSAVQVKGERLYEKARRGEEVERKPRPVRIFDFKVQRSSEDNQEVCFWVVCSKGTYIRSLCVDFAVSLNTCAHLTSLRREAIGDLSVKDAWPVKDLVTEFTRQQGLIE
eukprot:TRINITY_DN2701_c0_g8_i1.p1 TRINITY_DN2701_c0_g8~~TRINITY_DN2701_c0_g8_i1.p1  ORF type:complete len:194 (+),score=25.10 TRINITY_DN2701_c0_g8_i1:25-582(+)